MDNMQSTWRSTIVLMAASLDPNAKLVESALYRLNLSYRWLAKQLEVNHASVAQWLSAARAPRDPKVFQKMLQILDEYEKGLTNDGVIAIKRAGARIIPLYVAADGSTGEITMTKIESMRWLDWGTPEERYAIRVLGIDMEPEILPGDDVIFEKRLAQPGHVVHAQVDGVNTIKVLMGAPGRYRLVALNPETESPHGENIRILGVAVAVRRGLANGGEQRTEWESGMTARAPKTH